MGAAAPVPSGSAKVEGPDEERQEICKCLLGETRVRVTVLFVKGKRETKDEEARRDLGAMGF